MAFLHWWRVNPLGRSRQALSDDGSVFAEGFSLLTTEHDIHWLSDNPLVNLTIYITFGKKSSSAEWDSQSHFGDAVPMSHLSQPQVWNCPRGSSVIAGGHKGTALSKNPSLNYRSKSTSLCTTWLKILAFKIFEGVERDTCFPPLIYKLIWAYKHWEKVDLGLM